MTYFVFSFMILIIYAVIAITALVILIYLIIKRINEYGNEDFEHRDN
jgi:uncharacterized membrane protein